MSKQPIRVSASPGQDEPARDVTNPDPAIFTPVEQLATLHTALTVQAFSRLPAALHTTIVAALLVAAGLPQQTKMRIEHDHAGPLIVLVESDDADRDLRAIFDALHLLYHVTQASAPMTFQASPAVEHYRDLMVEGGSTIVLITPAD